jgi:hypothetical protein
VFEADFGDEYELSERSSREAALLVKFAVERAGIRAESLRDEFVSRGWNMPAAGPLRKVARVVTNTLICPLEAVNFKGMASTPIGELVPKVGKFHPQGASFALRVFSHQVITRD